MYNVLCERCHVRWLKTPCAVVYRGCLTDREHCYNMTHQHRGKLIVISNRYFLPQSRMASSPRHGTEFDVEDLRLTFRQLGFDCEVHEDRTRAQMLDIFLNGGQS